MFIDCDTHVDESDDTWSYIPEESKYLAPRTIEFTEDERPSFLVRTGSALGYYRFWFIDGRLAPRRRRLDERTGTTEGTRELRDVQGRLQDMDALDVDVQVIYPTMFLHEPTQRADLLVILHRSYNRWMADRCAESGGRLRWVAMIPYASPADALEEMRFAKEHGAVGIFKLGIECGGRNAGDPFFFPAYTAAADLDLALCIHQGTPWTPVHSQLSPFIRGDGGEIPVQDAFIALLRARLANRLPETLRVGFVEAGSAWLAHVLGSAGWQWSSSWADREHVFSDLQFYVACETYEDLPYILNVIGGADNLMIGTDYSHGDRASVMSAHKDLLSRADIDEKTALKITSENGRALYGI